MEHKNENCERIYWYDCGKELGSECFENPEMHQKIAGCKVLFYMDKYGLMGKRSTSGSSISIFPVMYFVHNLVFSASSRFFEVQRSSPLDLG